MTVLIKKISFYLKRYGPVDFAGKVYRKIVTLRIDRNRDKEYGIWITQQEKLKDYGTQRAAVFPIAPLVSIAVPVFDTPPEILRATLKSAADQTYSNWEMCVADVGGSEAAAAVLAEFSGVDERIKVIKLPENKGIAGNTNAAVSIASGEFVAFLDHDDLLAPSALFAVVRAINEEPDADFIYSDEDRVSEDGRRRMKPHFKPDFAPDTLRSYNYISHLTVVKKTLGDSIGWFRDGFDGSQDYDLILRATEKASRVVHIPHVLYHWRVSRSSVAGDPGNKIYAYEAARRALAEHLGRVGLEGEVEFAHLPTSYRVTYTLDGNPGVSIIIADSGGVAALQRCVESIKQRSTYENYEIIIFRNESEKPRPHRFYDRLRQEANVRAFDWSGPFNISAMSNAAAAEAEHPVLLFLKDNTEILTTGWIECMLGYALRKDVGAVGAKSYSADNAIQNAGVIVGLFGAAGHPFSGMPRAHLGYANRLMVTQNLSAVTGACLMTRREIFDEVGGFDESLSTAYNDIDMCLKMRSRGYLIVWTPFAELRYHESGSLNKDGSPAKLSRLETEREIFAKHWKPVLDAGDPYYNSNLALDRNDFGLRKNKQE